MENGADDACASGSCPPELYCGESRTFCEGGFGIRPCIDGKCGPAPGYCYSAKQDLRTCTEICAVTDAVCVARACEGVTAYSYPGPPHLASAYDQLCGHNTEEVKAKVTTHTFECDEELPWSDDVSIFQCCCERIAQSRDRERPSPAAAACRAARRRSSAGSSVRRPAR
jgi:hypothetical protein